MKDNNLDVTPSSRPLGGFELVMAQLGESMGPDMIIAQVRGPMSADLLEYAAFRVQQRHPSLRASIHWPKGDAAARPRFEYQQATLGAVDIEVVDPTQAGEPNDPRAVWQQVAEQLSQHRFRLSEGFLMRLVWVPEQSNEPQGTLICAAHHAVVDGTSLMRVLNELLAACGAIAERMHKDNTSCALAATALPPVQSLPATPAVTEMLSFSLLDKLAISIGRRQLVRAQRNFVKTPTLPVARALERDEQVKTLCFFHSGEQRGWDALDGARKAHGVTVGGAFAAAIQSAVLKHLQRIGAPVPMKRGRVHLPMSMDYNMRTRLDRDQLHPHAVGLYTGIADVGISVPATIGFWDLAAQLSHSAHEQARKRMPSLFQGVADTLPDLAAFTKTNRIDFTATGGTGESINISNVGRYPWPDTHGDFALEHVFGFNGACVMGPMLIFWLRHVRGHLCYNAIAASPACERSAAQSIFNNVCHLMENAGEDQQWLRAAA